MLCLDRLRGRTVVGCSIGALLLLHGAVGAFAQSPEGTGIPQGRPAPETQADSETGDSETDADQFAVPVRILEAPEDTERREGKEQRAEKREQNDLEAQRSMAESARKMLGPAWWQVGIAGAGALLLSVSLGVSGWAAIAASKAAKAAQEVLKAERAWLTYHSVDTDHLINFTLLGTTHERAVGFKIGWINSGRTPALKVDVWTDLQIDAPNSEVPIFSKCTANTASGGAVIGPGVGSYSATSHVVGRDFEAIVQMRAKAFIYSRVDYIDIFNPKTTRISEACVCIRCVRGMPDPIFTMTPMGNQNTAT